MLQTQEGLFHVKVEGPENAPALIFSNSLGCNLSMWDAQAAALRARYRIIRYDSRGHGRSLVSPPPFSIAQLARDALAILDELSIRKAHWCGLSKGGMVGQWLLTHAADRLGKVVLANTAPKMGPPGLWNTRMRIARTQGMEALAPSIIERWLSAGFRAADPSAVERVRDMLLTTPAEGYAACCGAIRDMDQREAIRSVDGRNVLVIVGEHDPATPAEAGRLIAQSMRGAQCVSLDAAHISNIEQETAFTQALATHLDARS
jgi:3-oxoadipate enol-lactonase